MKRIERTVTVDGREVQVLYVEREKAGRSRVHVFVEAGTETVLDDLMNRRSRPTAEWRVLATRAFRELGYEPEAVYAELRWSQKAGCSCGCSPGFVMRRSLQHVPPRRPGECGDSADFSWRGFDVMITPQPKDPVLPRGVVLGEN